MELNKKFSKLFKCRRYGLLIVFKLIFSLSVFSQGMVEGVVSDQQGNPVPGANVIIKGTTTGVITDLNGKFTIEVPEGNTVLLISFIGYLQKEVEVAGKSSLTIVMEEDITWLDEIVVIGYGTVKKEDLTGSISVVTAEDLTRTPINNVSKALQGKASGVVVFQNGEPGGGVNMRVRGIGSINLDPDPLFVVDGIVGVDINSFSPEDIESISVLKDASASAIYGANGANGVVVVTTKRGSKSTKPVINFSSSLSTSQIPNRFDLMNADEYAAFFNEVNALNNTQSPVAYTDNFRQQYYNGDWHKGTDWQNEILRKNISQNYYFNISQGTESNNYSISFNYLDEQGVLLKAASKRFNLRASSDFILNKYVKIGKTVSITRKNQNDPNNGAWGMAIEATPLMNIYNPNNKEGFEGTMVDFNYTDTLGQPAMDRNTGGNDKYNPVGELLIPNRNRTYDNLVGDAYIEIKPLKGFTFKSTGSVNAYFNETHEWKPAYDMGARSNTSASLVNNHSRGQHFQIKNQLSYNLTAGKHNLDATAVHDYRFGSGRNLDASSSDFPYEQLPVISQGTVKDVTGGEYKNAELSSYLGRVLYSFDSKYLFSASIRHDGSPNFLKGRRWGTFPAFSFGWKINEDFLQNVDQINMLKLRVGWGKTGNSSIGNYHYVTRIGTPIYFRPVFGLDQTEVYALNEDVWSGPGNQSIKWEASEMTNIGFDINAFNNKIQFSGEYYYKKSDDLLYQVPISMIHGKGINWNPGKMWDNIGEVVNKGFEFNITYSKMEGNFNYRTFANLSTVNNKVTFVPTKIQGTNTIIQQGHPIGSLYAFEAPRIIQESDFDEEGNFLYATPTGKTPRPGDLLFSDLDTNDIINDDDRKIVGKPIPDFTYSFGFECYYKNFDLSVFFYGIQNVEIINTSRSKTEVFRTQDMDHNKSAEWAANYYGKDGKPSTKYIRADRNDDYQNSRVSSWWVDDASFLRLKDLQIGYKVPKNVLNRTGINSARIYVSGMNLLTFTKYKGYDPESPLNNDKPAAPGVDENKYPISRVFTFGIQMSL